MLYLSKNYMLTLKDLENLKERFIRVLIVLYINRYWEPSYEQIEEAYKQKNEPKVKEAFAVLVDKILHD